VREKGDADAPSIQVEFGAGTATGKASVDFHVRAASLLAVKRPFTEEDVAALTGDS
jgi:hypothetical protein